MEGNPQEAAMSGSVREATDRMKDEAKVVVKDVKVVADDLVKTVRDLIHQGNVRRITVKDKNGQVIAIFPLAAGVASLLLAPALAAVGALAAVVAEFTLTVEKTE
jgi:hypothetical protein